MANSFTFLVQGSDAAPYHTGSKCLQENSLQQITRYLELEINTVNSLNVNVLFIMLGHIVNEKGGLIVPLMISWFQK